MTSSDAAWNPRYAAYARAHGRTPEEQNRHDHEANAPGYLEPFMTWLSARWAEWRRLRGLPAGIMGSGLSVEQTADFGAWLEDLGRDQRDGDYQAFLAAKTPTIRPRGIEDVPKLGSHLFPHQAHCVEFGLRIGSWLCALDTGLGKSLCELEWATHALPHSNGFALILTPLAVARQIEAEAKRWGYDARVIREQADVRRGINICNYDRLERLDAMAFGIVAADEASILKSFTGKTTRRLIETFSGYRWRNGSTATPAPNDHMELGQHAEFLGVMPSNEMLMRWFVADQTEMGRYRLKGHAVTAFWDWMASWSRMAEHPRDLGFEVDGYDLPPLNVVRHRCEEPAAPMDGGLFGAVAVSATDMFRIKRQTSSARAAVAAALVTGDQEPWVIWCDTNDEADALLLALRGRSDVVEVRGSHSVEQKEDALAAFADGSARVLITKSSICGYGLNWQHCSKTVFVGRTFSYESWYQAVRRFWRFGQARTVDVHLIVASGEDAIGRVIDRKGDDHARMKAAMVAATRRATSGAAQIRAAYNPTHVGHLPGWLEVAR